MLVTIEGNDEVSTCFKQFPIGFRDYELGGGHFDCGSAADQIGFYGDSNEDTGSVGTVYWNALYTLCELDNGELARPKYEGDFPLTCTHDAGNNATCTPADLPVTLPLAGWLY